MDALGEGEVRQSGCYSLEGCHLLLGFYRCLVDGEGVTGGWAVKASLVSAEHSNIIMISKCPSNVTIS